MAADSTLVKGAREASAYYGGVVDKARNELFDNLNKQVENVAAKKQAAALEQKKEQDKIQKQEDKEAKALQAQWDKQTMGNANSILASDGDLTGDNYSALYDDINGDLKNRFINGTPKERALALNELQKRTQEVNGMKEYSVENAALLVNANKSGQPFNPDGYCLALDDDAYSKEKSILAGHTESNSFNVSDDYNEAGERIGSKVGFRGGYDEETGEYAFMGGEEAGALSDMFRVDQQSQAELMSLQNTMYDLADEGDHTSSFNVNAAKSRVKSIINASNKKLSLMYDPMIEGRSFKDDLFKGDLLAGVTYEQLGISPDQAYAMEKAAGEKNPDGVIGSDNLTAEDQRLILSQFMTSGDMEEERENMLVTYYTDIMRQSWQKRHGEVVSEYYRANPGAVAAQYTEEELKQLARQAQKGEVEQGAENIVNIG